MTHIYKVKVSSENKQTTNGLLIIFCFQELRNNIIIDHIIVLFVYKNIKNLMIFIIITGGHDVESPLHVPHKNLLQIIDRKIKIDEPLVNKIFLSFITT